MEPPSLKHPLEGHAENIGGGGNPPKGLEEPKEGDENGISPEKQKDGPGQRGLQGSNKEEEETVHSPVDELLVGETSVGSKKDVHPVKEDKESKDKGEALGKDERGAEVEADKAQENPCTADEEEEGIALKAKIESPVVGGKENQGKEEPENDVFKKREQRRSLLRLFRFPRKTPGFLRFCRHVSTS
jgi:hypothetical protein